MLTYFPTPYPDEWWYSVLCRYHVRSGNSKHQSTIKELIPGRITAAVGSVYPNSTIRQILSGLPAGLLSVKEVIIRNTLFPYYSRFSSFDKKTAMLEQLCRGETIVITSIRKFTAKSIPRYCPQCVSEDRRTYGEAYWHIEHQIPLMMLCPVHGCLLQAADNIIPTHIDYTFYPLESVCPDGNLPRSPPNTLPWQSTYSRILADYQRLPLTASAVPDCNNLAMSLSNMGYGIIQNRSPNTILDAKKLYWDMVETYGGEFVELVFGDEASICTINRACKWEIASPERYALLQDFAGITSEEVFSKKPQRDRYEDKLLTLQKTGNSYTKKQVQECLSITAAQLDILTKRYGIEPFWKEKGGGRTKQIHLTLTAEEKQRIAKAAAIHGNGQTAVFAREVLLREVNQILQNDGGTIK
jgi:hypothetical protein